MTKFKLDLRILMTVPYARLDNERKVNDDGMTGQGNTICPRPFFAESIKRAHASLSIY
jgi:hypothetical protein